MNFIKKLGLVHRFSQINETCLPREGGDPSLNQAGYHCKNGFPPSRERHGGRNHEQGQKLRCIRGITLIEILLILMLVAILTSIFARFYLIYTEHPTSTRVQQNVLTLENGLKFYKLDNGFYPTNEQGLAALVRKPKTQPIPQHWVQYLKNIPRDPRGKPYRYTHPGKSREIEVYSDSPLVSDLFSWLRNEIAVFWCNYILRPNATTSSVMCF